MPSGLYGRGSRFGASVRTLWKVVLAATGCCHPKLCFEHYYGCGIVNEGAEITGSSTNLKRNRKSALGLTETPAIVQRFRAVEP